MQENPSNLGSYHDGNECILQPFNDVQLSPARTVHVDEIQIWLGADTEEEKEHTSEKGSNSSGENPFSVELNGLEDESSSYEFWLKVEVFVKYGNEFLPLLKKPILVDTSYRKNQSWDFSHLLDEKRRKIPPSSVVCVQRRYLGPSASGINSANFVTLKMV